MTSKVESNIRYAGFNVRLLANLVDIVLLFLITMPIYLITKEAGVLAHPDYIHQALNDFELGKISQTEFFQIFLPYLNEKVPRFIKYSIIDFFIVGGIFLAFWKWKNSTPGKLLFKLSIIDDKTLSYPTTKQYILRFIGYVIATIPACLGFITIPFNKRRKGLHDFISGTSVIHLEHYDAEKEKKIFKYKTYFFLALILIFAIIVASK